MSATAKDYMEAVKNSPVFQYIETIAEPQNVLDNSDSRNIGLYILHELSLEIYNRHISGSLIDDEADALNNYKREMDSYYITNVNYNSEKEELTIFTAKPELFDNDKILQYLHEILVELYNEKKIGYMCKALEIKKEILSLTDALYSGLKHFILENANLELQWG